MNCSMHPHPLHVVFQLGTELLGCVLRPFGSPFPFKQCSTTQIFVLVAFCSKWLVILGYLIFICHGYVLSWACFFLCIVDLRNDRLDNEVQCGELIQWSICKLWCSQIIIRKWLGCIRRWFINPSCRATIHLAWFKNLLVVCTEAVFGVCLIPHDWMTWVMVPGVF